MTERKKTDAGHPSASSAATGSAALLAERYLDLWLANVTAWAGESEMASAAALTGMAQRIAISMREAGPENAGPENAGPENAGPENAGPAGDDHEG